MRGRRGFQLRLRWRLENHFLLMDSPNVEQYVVGIYADYQGVGITLIGTNQEIDRFWVYDHIHLDKASIEAIKTCLDDLFLRFPQIRKIHVNNIESLRQELNICYKDKLYIDKRDLVKNGFIYYERRSEVKVIELEVENLTFTLNSYINDGRLIFNNSLLENKSNLKSEIENYQLQDINQNVFSLYIAISEIDPIKLKFLCGSVSAG